MSIEVDKSNDNKRQVRQDLEERLIQFGILIIRTCEGMPRTPAGVHLSGQMLRSGTSPALNYAEAKAAESHRDFTDKIKVVLKELRETWVNLRMVGGAGIHADKTIVSGALAEGDQLVAIFTQSVKTAEQKSPPKK
jgi:four helix bundle protein